MGKTYRQEKTFGNKKKRPRLNNHRDLPDTQDSPDDEEEFYAKAIRPKELPFDTPEDRSYPQDDQD